MPPQSAGAILIDIEVDRRQVDRMLSAIELTLMGHNIFKYLRDVMQPYMRERARRRFAQEGDDASGPWAPLLEVTNDIRENFGFPREHPINRRTGELENFMLRGALDYTMQPNAASMFFPGIPPSRALKEKLTTAQRGRTEPGTVPRPVARVSMADMSFFMNSFAFWFGTEVREKFGMSLMP